MNRRNKQTDTAWSFETPEEWRAAMKVCRSCADALNTERGISDGFVEYKTTLREEVNKLINRFGLAALTQVISDTLRDGANDGRYENRIIDWGKAHPLFPPIPGKAYGPDGPRLFLTGLHPEHVRAVAYTIIAIERKQAKQAADKPHPRKRER